MKICNRRANLFRSIFISSIKTGMLWIKEFGVNIFSFPFQILVQSDLYSSTRRREEEENLHVSTEERLATLKKDASDD